MTSNKMFILCCNIIYIAYSLENGLCPMCNVKNPQMCKLTKPQTCGSDKSACMSSNNSYLVEVNPRDGMLK